jgi:hypothetical protein
VFHDTAAEAAAEGFRACKRCRPELRDGEGNPQKIAVEKACGLIRKEQPGDEDGKWSVKALATEVGLTESHFCRIFKKVMGMTVGEYRAFISLGNTQTSSEMAFMDLDKAHEANVDQDSGGPFPTPNLPLDFEAENWFPLTDSAFPESEQDWHRFSGVSLSMTIFNTPHVHLGLTNLDQSSPDPFSGLTDSGTIDDGLQFFDFDNHSSGLPN